MKGKYKAAIALLLALVLLPLALLLTLTHWVPTLAGIWLPAGTRISLNESPRLTRSALRIPDLRYLVGDCEIARVAKDGVGGDELARARAQLVAGQIYKLDSMFAQAMEIGQLETAGVPYAAERKLLEKLQAVSADQVQAVAKKYFVDEQLTVAELDPQPLPDSPRARPAVTLRH